MEASEMATGSGVQVTEPGGAAVPRSRHSDRIAAELRDDILRGRYRPGQRLPAERELASRLSVNRGSVREALKKLEQLGLVEIRRGDGALVRHLHEASIEVMRDLLHLGDGLERRVLEEILDVHEMLLAGTAALAVERLSESALARARVLVAELATPGRTAFEFHVRVEALAELAAEISGHLMLRLFRNTFRPAIVEGLRALDPYFPEAEAGVGDAVRNLDAALVARSPEAAAAAVRAVARLARVRLTRALDAYEADRKRPPLP
jgi:GntR family transcriptional repressor for pyruvate dehydrogenase complex